MADPPLNIPSMRVQFRGPINWRNVYRGSVSYFKSRKFDFAEKNYKDKSNEFEGEWGIEMEIDAYNKVAYTVKFKAWDLAPAKAADGSPAWNGKLRVELTGQVIGHYDKRNPAGTREIFEENSFLHKAYKAVTRRDREEQIMGFAIGVAQQYFAWLKQECGMEARILG